MCGQVAWAYIAYQFSFFFYDSTPYQWQLTVVMLNWSKVQYISSATNSSSGLIFVKIRAESGRIFSKNPGKTKVFVSLSSICG